MPHHMVPSKGCWVVPTCAHGPGESEEEAGMPRMTQSQGHTVTANFLFVRRVSLRPANHLAMLLGDVQQGGHMGVTLPARGPALDSWN